jgi:dipeptidyl aminopeptidase/acylaminoacyl peptidase
MPWFRLAVTLLVPALAHAAEKIPVESFVRNPGYSAAQISPDGKYLGFSSSVGEKGGKPALFFVDLATGKMAKVEPPTVEGRVNTSTLTSFAWVNNQRVLFTTSGLGMSMAINRDGSKFLRLSGIESTVTASTLFASELIHVFNDGSGRVLMLQRDYVGNNYKYPSVVEINTLTGDAVLVAENTVHEVNVWVPDRAGQVRIGVKWDGERTSVIHRENDQAPWERLRDFDTQGRGGYPLAFDHDGRTVYTAALTEHGTWGLYPYDLVTRKLGPLIFADKTYDIINPNDFSLQTNLLFSGTKQKLVGLRYLAEGSKTVWFDDDWRQVQETLDRALPGVVNSVIGWSDDESSVLAISWTDRQPGVYYLLEKKSQQLRNMVNRASWIDPEQIAPTRPFKFKARDGLMVHGYLTLPLGAALKNLPLVVMPHGGPWVRDTLSYDPLVKFLANRGYAVMQVNYRGSPGYGEAFSRAGRRQIGKAVQDDITDGLKWALKLGLADPKRVAIVGASYGGYSALWALTNTPELYCCGITMVGVSDWLSILAQRNRSSDTRDVYRFWSDQIGDPETDEATLRAISPLYQVERIKAPVLVMHGMSDPVVPPNQSTRLIAELKRLNLPHEELLKPGEGHGFTGYRNRVELFKRIEAFLAKHMQ